MIFGSVEKTLFVKFLGQKAQYLHKILSSQQLLSAFSMLALPNYQVKDIVDLNNAMHPHNRPNEANRIYL